MSSGRQLLTLVGQAAGAFVGGPIGAAVGGIIGGELGGVIDGPPEGPRLGDLSAPQIEFGGKIPRLYGGPRWFEVSPIWMSEKTEHSEVVGGKGGDSGVETFSYTVNMLVRITESREGTPCEVLAVTGVEIDGELIWTSLADASPESLAASDAQEIWSSMTVLTGSETQSPWSIYEAAVGVANAIAFRGYCTVGFENFLLAPNGMPRRIRIQAITVGSGGGEGVIFDYTGNVQHYVVPDDVTSLNVVGWGGGGGGGSEGPSGGGSGYVTGTITVTPGQTLDIFVGGGGSGGAWPGFWPSAAYPNGGRAGVRNNLQLGGGGGGSSAVAVGGGGSKLIIAPGGGGGGSIDESGYPSGSGAFHAGDLDGVVGGGAGTAIAGGIRGNLGVDDKSAGGHGSFTAQGDGGGGANGNDLTNPYGAAGGGGGGGWHGGGGGGGGGNLSVPADGGGGGGGSELLPGGGTVEHGVGNVPGGIDSPYYASGLGVGGAGGPGGNGRIVIVGTGWTPGQVDLRDILEYEASRCFPLAAANIDFSAAEGIPVDCHVAIGSAADAMQPLLTRFWFDLYSSDKLYLVRRGGSVEQTISFAFTGANSEGFPGLIRSNDVEVPKKKAITYSNLLADGESDTRTGDRESAGSDVDTLPMNLNMLPSEAQGLADTATFDGRIAGHTATVRIGARQGLRLQPGSVISIIDHKGNTYRVLVRRLVWDRWAWQCDVRLDDPTVLAAAGIAVDLDQRSLVVATPPDATLYVLDIPLLRIEDNAPGEYVAVTCTGRWRGVTLHKSSDDITYTQRGEVTTRATAGQCDSTLPAFDGWGWDNSSTLTVTLDDGSGGDLSTATKAAVEASRSLNLAAVGVHGRWELIQFATATLLTGSTYQLTGFLRNLFGTEWASGDHTGADVFVLMTPALGRIPGAVSDLGQTRYYKAVPSGRSISNITPESIVCEEQCLLPYAPTDVWNDAGTIKWNRRSRIEGAIGLDPPLGEASERYDAELYDGLTLEDSDSGLTTPEWTPVDPSGLTVRVYQLSDLVGRGHVAEKEMT